MTIYNILSRITFLRVTAGQKDDHKHNSSLISLIKYHVGLKGGRVASDRY